MEERPWARTASKALMPRAEQMERRGSPESAAGTPEGPLQAMEASPSPLPMVARMILVSGEAQRESQRRAAEVAGEPDAALAVAAEELDAALEARRQKFAATPR